MQAAFVVLLDLSEYNYVRRLQVKIYDLFGAKETLKLEPHITLKYAFEVSELDDYEGYFDDLLKKTSSFEIELDRIDSFESKVVYLGVSDNKALSGLHLKILKDFNEKFSVGPAEFEGENFNFHVTLAYKDITEETFLKIKEYFKDENPKLRFLVKKLGMYLKLNENENWFVYKVGELNKE